MIRRDESGTLEQFEVAANVMVFEDNIFMEKHQYAYLVRTINEQGFQETLYEQIDIPSCMVTGVFSERDESLRVYPNPARNIVNVEGLKSGYNQQLFSVSGVMVWHGQSLGTRMEFSVDSYPSGFYLLQAQGESGIEIVRIIVQ